MKVKIFDIEMQRMCVREYAKLEEMNENILLAIFMESKGMREISHKCYNV